MNALHNKIILSCNLSVKELTWKQCIFKIMAFIRPLSEALQKKAIEELNEVPERIPEDIKALREWIEKKPHLKARTDDQFLITFLRGSKFNLEKAKEKIDLFYAVRSAIPELFSKRDPQDSKVLEVFKCRGLLPLPNLISPDSHRLFFCTVRDLNPDQVSAIDFFTVYYNVFDILMREDDNMVVSGVKLIVDMANYPLPYLAQLTPTFVKKLVILTQEASPLRLKGILYINVPPGVETVINLIKSFLNEKNKPRLKVFGTDLTEFYKEVPQKIMPAEYGGEAGSMNEIANSWEKKLLNYRDYLLDELNYGTDEEKRPGQPKNSETLFGVEGSFRELTVD